MDEHSYAYSSNAPIEAAPRRVVSLSPALTLTLAELGLADRLVAVSELPRLAGEAAAPGVETARLPRVGDSAAPEVERIAALRPDVVMALADDTPADAARALENAGLTVWLADPRTAREAVNLLWEIMQAFDETAMVARVRLIERTLDYVAGAAASRGPRRTFVALSRAGQLAAGRWMTFNAETYAHDLLRVCGGENVFAARESRYFAVTEAEAAAAQPDVVLLADDSGAASFSPIESGHVHLISPVLLWPGTPLARALGALPALLMSGVPARSSAGGPSAASG